MNNKRSQAPDSSMASMSNSCYSGSSDVDEKYTLPPDYAMGMNKPYTKQDVMPMNVDAAFNAGLVLRQKL